MSNVNSWDLIESRKTNGTEKLKCPICTPIRKNKNDKSLMVWHNNGTAKCFNDSCNALFFRESIQKSIIQNNYTLPSQEWKNYTNLSDALVKHCESERKINQYTLKHFGVSEEKFYQPALNKEVNNIVFNYFEGDVLVNKKYRSGNKKFTQSKNGKPIFYNINSIIGEDEVYIVEGEFDVLALYEVGIKNVISIPNGANDNDNYWINSEKYLKEVKKFYIATDNDESGNNVAEKIAQRLGRYRCERVLFNGKDANDDLKDGTLKESIYNRKKYPVSGVFTTEDLIEKMINLYNDGLPNCIEVKNRALSCLNDKFKLMYGHLCIGTGIPSHGKSNFTEWLVINYLLENDVKASFFSPEHQPMELHMSTFVQKVIGKNYFFDIDKTPKVSKMEIMQFHSWANQKLYLTSPENGEFANWDWIFEKFREQIYSFGINIFVVDAWNKVEHSGNKTERENIGLTLSRLTQFAQQNNVLIIVIAHPTKMKKENGIYEQPTLYDVSGSADFRNQTHDGFCVYRYFGEDSYTKFTNLKTKYSFQGEIGASLEFDYHKPSGRYYERGTNPQEENLIDANKQKIEVKENSLIEEIAPFPLIKMEELKGVFDDLPYNDEDEVPF
jgi:twinkle protein